MEISCCWLYAISKYGYPPSIPDSFKALEEMAEMGFNAVELEGVYEDNLRAVAGIRADLRNRCADLGLRVVNFSPVLPDLVSPDDGRRRHALDLFRLGVELATYFETSVVQVDSFAPPIEFLSSQPYGATIEFGSHPRVKIPAGFSWDRTWRVLVDSMRKCAMAVRDAGLRLALEPRVGEIAGNTDALLRLVEHVADPALGVIFDTAHLHAQKELLPLSVEKLGNRIFYVHAADNDSRENEHLAPGRGTIDWETLFAGLRRHGFDGNVGIDIGDVTDLDNQYREGRAFIRSVLERVTESVHEK